MNRAPLRKPTTNDQKRLMDKVALVMSNAKPTEEHQPADRGFHAPAGNHGSVAVLGIFVCHHLFDLVFSQWPAGLVAVSVTPIRPHCFGISTQTALRPCDWRDRIRRSDYQGAVVAFGAGVRDRKRESFAMSDQVALAGILPKICGFAVGAEPLKRARTEHKVAIARDQSIASAWPSLSRRDSHRRCQIGAVCQSRRRREQVVSYLQAMSWGCISHWSPECKGNEMLVRAARSGTRAPPAAAPRPGGSGGKGGWFCSRDASGGSELAIFASCVTRSIHRPDHRDKDRLC